MRKLASSRSSVHRQIADKRQEGDWPDTCMVVVDPPRIAAILRRVAYDVEELTRARRVEDLRTAAVGEDPRAERRRRMAEPDLDLGQFCERTGTPWRSTDQGDRAWAAYQAERRRRGETDEDPHRAYNPFHQRRVF